MARTQSQALFSNWQEVFFLNKYCNVIKLIAAGCLGLLQVPDLALHPRSAAYPEIPAAHHPLINVSPNDSSSLTTIKKPSTGLVWRRHFNGKLRSERLDTRPPLVPNSNETKYKGHRKQLVASGG